MNMSIKACAPHHTISPKHSHLCSQAVLPELPVPSAPGTAALVPEPWGGLPACPGHPGRCSHKSLLALAAPAGLSRPTQCPGFGQTRGLCSAPPWAGVRGSPSPSPAQGTEQELGQECPSVLLPTLTSQHGDSASTGQPCLGRAVPPNIDKTNIDISNMFIKH